MSHHKQQPEQRTRLALIDPVLKQKGWADAHIHREYKITDGQIMVQDGKTRRAASKFADYLLTTNNGHTPLAIIEAKHSGKNIRNGIQQALNYATMLDVPFVYATNGAGFIEHDRITGQERELRMDNFPTPEALWQRYITQSQMSEDEIHALSQPYHYKIDGNTPRYYQRIAIDRTVQAVARGDKRILLVMATGTGKTYTAFQIMWRLREAGQVKKILYLADRNILIDQTISKDFSPFSKVITKVKGSKLDSAYEIYMSLYQQLTGEDDRNEPYKAFSPDFFDLIVVDECHRGSAKYDSRWRKILDYFHTAIQLGLTATPKETKDTSNITYFGEPIYTYSLKQGIQDGFLAPYSVIRLTTDKDEWTPPTGTTDRDGNELEDRTYTNKDYDRTIVLTEREKMVAKRITQWLTQHDRYAKTIVFCVDIDHAGRMRQALVNENSDLIRQDNRYVMQITGDNDEGKAQLENFIDPREKYPTIATTSKLLTTGVDCKTCKLIVLDSNINSMTEFKQIIGRGTRVDEEHNKMNFTIMDFRGATRLFEDKDFDGEPVVIYEGPLGIPPEEEPTEEPTGEAPPTEPPSGGIISDPPTSPPEPPPPPRQKIIVDGVTVEIEKEIVKIYTLDGTLSTQSIKDYTIQNIHEQYGTLDRFIQTWFAVEKKQAIMDALAEKGVDLALLERLVGRADLDAFDLITHIAYDCPPLTRSERANNVKKRGYLHQYSGICQQVLDLLLEKYQNDGLFSLETTEILKTSDFEQFGSPMQIVKAFGGKVQFFNTTRALQNELYQTAS
ncbi:MAG: DEAD/DEAH box helicase family protein [Acinetobacter sp.]|nr:DEAD/DEAH box helicase family protein [Acinetobacter sp.]